MEKSTVVTAYGASFTATFMGYSINEWVAIGGLVIGLATFLTNLWFKREHLKLAQKQAQGE
ncbi:phage holin [Marinomonas sp. PE14-40]|uniref:phage holin n=1 Tax=Marinomonas sp. PE14-40 TaxID=3060621 RepID=UPI003F67E4A6